MNTSHPSASNRSSVLRKPKRLILLGLAAILAPLALAASPASASAYGSATFGSRVATVPGVGTFPLPGVTVYHRISGSGLRIDAEQAKFQTWVSGNLCNWRFDFRYYSTSGSSAYSVYRGPLNRGCAASGASPIVGGRLPVAGKACAYLYSNGAYVGKQCHSVF